MRSTGGSAQHRSAGDRPRWAVSGQAVANNSPGHSCDHLPDQLRCARHLHVHVAVSRALHPARPAGDWRFYQHRQCPANQAFQVVPPGRAGHLLQLRGAALFEPVAHLARHPLDPDFDRDAVVKVLRGKHSEIKRQLLDQTVVSGIGNIYADEALWRARVNGFRIAEKLGRPKLAEVLDSAAEVMRAALAQGGTSFDSLYVNVNGESGYFDRSLDAYGREGEPCRRCGAIIRREKFMNRSSFYCPRCQPHPRR